ncbi:MAG: biotin--[acetyl-CoA-carboxylase] ligase [Sphingobacterium sp.]
MQNNTFSGETPRQKLIVLDEIGSTNDYFKTDSTNFKPLPEWSAIMAKHQTAGRGQRGNTWIVAPGVNLTFSVLLYPNFLSLPQHFTLNILVSLSIIDWLDRLGIPAQIKWPNDIIIHHKKVAGFLIENSSRAGKINKSILGIGVNINQTEFPSDLKEKATSLQLQTGQKWDDLPQLCLALLERLQRRVNSYKEQRVSSASLLSQYNQHLYRIGVSSCFRCPEKGKVKGTIEKVDMDGQLIIRHQDGDIYTYRFKEIEFI